jgi:hypothetical protein
VKSNNSEMINRILLHCNPSATISAHNPWYVPPIKQIPATFAPFQHEDTIEFLTVVMITKSILFSDIILHSTSAWCQASEDSVLHKKHYAFQHKAWSPFQW